MRKILLATTALVGVAFAASAQAAPPPASPISLNVGGYVDAIAGFYHTDAGAQPTLSTFDPVSGSTISAKIAPTSRDFETEFKLNFDAMGKAGNGMEYGANVALWNGPEVTNLWTGGGNSIELASAYVWMSGAFGKFMFGDEHGASDLFVYAPSVGEGQTDGRFLDFVSPFALARFQASGIDNTEHSTKVTYYTPKVGNESNKVQLGVSYTPNFYDYGQNVVKGNVPANLVQNANLVNGSASPYQDVIEGGLNYTGNFNPVTVAASAQITTGSSGANRSGASGGTAPGLNPYVFAFAPVAQNGSIGDFQDFTAWAVGTQVGFDGVTLGASWADNGRYGTVHGQNEPQNVASFGAKYEFDKVGVAGSYLWGRGYDNLLAGATSTVNLGSSNYVSSYNAYGLGATYTWFPGLVSAVDGVMYFQDTRTTVSTVDPHNDGYVIMVSQKLAF